jgi:hypothetical protein
MESDAADGRASVGAGRAILTRVTPET